MKLLVALLIAGCLVLLVTLLLLAIAVHWSRRTAGQPRSGGGLGAAAAFLRQQVGDPRLPGRLRRLAADPRTPSRSRGLLVGLARYLDDPVVLAPDFVPFLGRLDEVAVGSVLLWLARRGIPSQVWADHFPSVAGPTRHPATASVGQARSGGLLAGELRRDAAAGRHAELLRRLNRALPEWPVSAALVEAVRELLELERNVALARDAGVSEAVTDRLARQAEEAAESLWLRADRLAAAGAYGIESPRLREDLDQEDARLTRLRAAIREARTGLAELTVAGGEEGDALRRADVRFRALAATARELRDLDRGPDA